MYLRPHITAPSWILAYQRQSVAQRQEDFLYAGVVHHEVVEVFDAGSLAVAALGHFEHMAVPQRVVSKDEAAGTEHGQRHFVRLDICALVAVDESHVELYAQFWCLLYGVANDKAYLVGHGRVFNPRTREVFLLVVYLVCVHHSAFFQSFGHAYSTVSAERSHLKDILRTYHPHQHLQQPALQVSARHASAQQVNVSGTPQSVKIVALRVDMGQNVVF